MAEILLGDVLARLRVDSSQFTTAMADAAQRLNALNQALAQTRTQSATTQQSTQQVAQAFQALNQSIQQQTQAYTQAQSATQQYRQAQLQLLDAIRQQRQEQQQATQAAQAHGSALRTALSVAGGIGLATSIGAIVGQMKELAVSTIQVGAQFQQLRTSLAAATGGSQQGAQSFQFLIETANRYGFSLQSVAGSYQGLAAATRGTNLEGEQTRRIFEAVTAAGRTVGATSEQMGRILTALQQMVSKGVVSMEELRQQLGESLPGAFQIAARAMGVTTERFSQMVAAGQVLTVDFLPKFARQLQQELGQGAVKAADTAQAAFARLENEWNLLKERVSRGGPLSFVVTVARKVTEALSEDRLEAEARQAAIERRARQLEVRPGPGARARPATLEGVTDEQQKSLSDAQQRLNDIEASIKRLGDPQNVPNFVMGPFREALADAQKRLDTLIQTINERRVGKAGVEARLTGVEEDPREREQEHLKYLESGRQAEERIAKILDEGRQQLRDIELNAPFLSELDLADQKFKSWEKTLKAVQEEMAKVGEGVRRALVPSGTPTAIDALIERIAGEKGLDPTLMRALVAQESNFDPRAVSRAGAKGLMQLMPGTAAAYGAGGREFDPETNLRAGMSYFAELLQKFNGNVERALTAYNAGPARGGIPLPTGENATFAQDVLRRMPQTLQGRLDAAARQQRALEAAQEAQTPDRERMAQTRATGREVLQAIDEEERQQDADARERRQQAMATGREYLRGLDEELRKRDQAVESLKTLERQYALTADAQKEDVAARLAAQFPQDEEIQTRAENVRLLIEERQAMESSFAVIKARTDAQREAQAASDAMTQSIEGTLERLRAPREERAELRLRAQARRQNIELTPDDDARLRAITEQERLNEALELTRRAGEAVSQSLTDGLLSLADRTQNVSEAFERMAKSIIESLARVAISAGFQALLKLGISALGGALSGGTTTVPASAGYQNVINTVPLGTAQGGAIINRPTALIAGENSLMNPEYVINRPQMQALLSAAPSAGGQAMGGPHVTVINVADRAEGERRAAQERSLGRQVVINYVMDELAQGSGSRIGQVLRNGQR